MAIKTKAQLTADNTAVVTGQTAPDSITPPTAGGHLQNIIDSMWNKLDDPLPGSTSGTALAGLVIPSCLTGVINNGDPLTSALQLLFDQYCAINSNMTIQGRAGMFLAKITDETRQTFTCTSASATPVANLALTDDSAEGGFDNGNNFDTVAYVAPALGFTGRFQMMSIEVELLDKTGTANASLIFQMQKNGVNFGSPITITFNLGTAAIGDKEYSSTVVEPPISNPATALTALDAITILVSELVVGGVDEAQLRVNRCIFKNQVN